MEKKRAVFRRSIRRFEQGKTSIRRKDSLLAEEPFTLVWWSLDGDSDRVSSTMRTPGDDMSLAAGILFSEQVIQGLSELKTLSFCSGGGVNELNRLKAELRISGTLTRERLSHRPSSSVPQSACGLCSVDVLSNPQALLDWAAARYKGRPAAGSQELLQRALHHLENSCPLFRATGASHATVLVDGRGDLLSLGEDVGRHNACDKAIGALLLADKDGRECFQLPPESGLLVSSRFSFELAYKAVAAGVSWMASVGAPTHLAVELAQRCGIPLYGFVSAERYNLYTAFDAVSN